MNGEEAVWVLTAGLGKSSRERLALLFDAHYDRLYRLARRLTSTTDDALDLVQETFLKAARSPQRIPEGSEEAWLVQVLIHTRRDQWRKEARRLREQASRLENTGRAASSSASAETAAIAKADVWQALNALSPRRRAVIVMYELEGMTMEAIASLLGINSITVRWHLSMGRRDLARILKGI